MSKRLRHYRPLKSKKLSVKEFEPAYDLRTYLLDTHIWCEFALNTQNKIAEQKLLLLDQAANEDRLKISIFSIWEVAMLVSKGRIHLTCDVKDWVNQALNSSRVSIAELTPEIAIESVHLPGGFHGDPADRIIVATARSLNAILVTRDRRILDYAKKGFVNALAL